MNINFEDIPKHDVSNKVLELLKKVTYKQDDFGLKKYNEPLHHSMVYDWDAMANEEMADYLKYRQCERERKANVIDILKEGLRSDEPKEFIEVALQLLTVGGTGK
ncbi:hypothetical protein [Cytobacillus sp.]|uniref:hypothetical protein n=1 Tax=Cytobacillus sp. TaxID=2675269 RepID=UPI0028BD425D|nr:hypothetical protein [Cytobacillus sp.]